MAEKGLITKDTLTAIADAIRAKTETSETMLPGEMAALIAGLEIGSKVQVLYGTTTLTKYGGSSLSLGTTLTGKYHAFVLAGEITSSPAERILYAHKVATKSKTSTLIMGRNADEGNLTSGVSISGSTVSFSGKFTLYNVKYHWLYIGGDDI